MTDGTPEPGDGGESGAPAGSAPVRPRGPHHLLAYALSLPERLLRALAGLLGGLGLRVARLLPGPVRKGRFYRLSVERQLRMLADDLGRAGLFPGEEALDTRTAVRLGVGGALDNVLVLGLHASPIWILLAAADVTQEAKRFARELADELKARGVMREGSRLDSLEDVLEGLSGLSSKLADSLDQPPLSLDEMKETVSALRQEIGGVSETAVTRTADLDGLARDLRGLAKRTDRPLLEVCAAVGVGAVRTTGRLVEGTLLGAASAVKIVGRRLWTDVVVDYGEAVRTIARQGLAGSLRAFLLPHARGTRRLLAYRFVTFTEIGLSLGCWRRAPWRA